MDALGFDIYGHHEGTEEIPQDPKQKSPSFLASILPRSSSSQSSSSKLSSASFARAIGATDFHLYNQDATGFDEDSSSESSSRETTITSSDRDKDTRSDQLSTQIDGHIVRSSADHANMVHTLKTSTSKSDSSSADTEELKAEERFRVGNATDFDAVLATTGNQDVKEGAKLVGVFGRDFDEPGTVAQHLQTGSNDSEIVYRPVIIPRRELLSSECQQYVQDCNYDVVVLCYNTSEARIMLTGEYGFYSNLLQYASRTPGQHNILFVLTHCETPEGDIIEEGMKHRISEQPDMKYYVADQVYSWYMEPSKKQREHITMKVLSSQKQKLVCVIL